MTELNRIISLWACIPVALMLTSCSYEVRPGPAVKALSIGHIDNRTHEPGLADFLREALTVELASRSVRVANGLENEISGTIESLDVTPLAEHGGAIVKFSVHIVGDFTLRTGAKGKQVKLSVPLSYIVAFGSDVPLDTLYSMREEAVRRAVFDLASDIAAAAVLSRR